jgi:membrane peptidoglycan carboxypeptidase
VLVVLLCSSLAGVRATGLDQLPSVSSLRTSSLPNDILLYDRSGKILVADLRSSDQRHYDLPLAEMGRWLPEATVAIDEAGFWSTPAVDPLTAATAGRGDGQTGSSRASGATIEQRLVRLRLPGHYEGLAGRLRQAALAVKISTAYSKSQVLEMYLNALFYGHSAYGPAAAAQTYFGVDPAGLDLAQAALLAGLPQMPTLYDPVRNWATARQRQRDVLDAMVKSHAISAQQADLSYSEPLQVSGNPGLDRVPYFTALAKGELYALFAHRLIGSGARVVTTLDWSLQQHAEQSLARALDANRSRGVGSGALVAIDPRSGELVAMASSADVGNPDQPLNPGTALRLFTYAAAIDSRKYTMVTPISDAPLSVEQPGIAPYRPKNFDFKYHGTCQLQACFGNGLNVPAIQVEMGLGVSAVVSTARALGAPPLVRGENGVVNAASSDSFGASLTLGGYPETVGQLATGVSVLAGGGILHPAHSVLSVRSPSGKTLFQAKPGTSAKRVLDQGTAFIVSEMLADDQNRAAVWGAGGPLLLPGRRAAALTGDTDGLTDAWSLGYTPSLAAVVWIGSPTGAPMGAGSPSFRVAAPAWHDFMETALSRMRKGDEWYLPPAGVESTVTNGRPAYFLGGTSALTPAPPLPASVHLQSAPGPAR